jgi:hypothetical protein
MTSGDRLTPSPYLKPAQVAQEIRDELKRRFGWCRKDVNVRGKSLGIEEAIRLSIRSPGVPVARVEHVASWYRDVRFYERSGDLLGGGNRFVSVSLDTEVYQPFVAPLCRRLEALPVSWEFNEIRVGRFCYLVAHVEPYGFAHFTFKRDHLSRLWSATEAANQIAYRLAQSRKWRQLLAELTA